MKKIIKLFKNPKILKLLLISLIVLLSLGSFILYEKMHDRVFIDNSLVDSPVTSIVPSTSGKLMENDVYEGEKINKGDLVAVVDSQTVHSDVNGIVIMANNQIGSMVSAQNPVAQVINPSNSRIAGAIDENKGLNDVKVGQTASFTVDALPGKTFWGYVDEISPSAKQTQLSFSISSERPTQQFIVYVRYDAYKDSEIKVGMSSKITVYTATY